MSSPPYECLYDEKDFLNTARSYMARQLPARFIVLIDNADALILPSIADQLNDETEAVWPMGRFIYHTTMWDPYICRWELYFELREKGIEDL